MNTIEKDDVLTRAEPETLPREEPTPAQKSPAQKSPAPKPPVSDTAKGIGLILSAFVLCVGFVVGLCWFLRPAVSETEKRELTAFPTFTLKSFLSGEFTEGISLWYADTFPGREGLIKAYHGISSLYGFGADYQGGEGDEVPDGPMELPDGDDTIVDRPNTGGENGEQVGGYYRVGDTAYELYFFSQSGAIRYASVINQAASSLEGKAQVYDLVIPLHYSFALSGEMQDKLGVADGGEVMRYIYSGLNNATGVDVYTPLMEHRDEYIYFRTDHHWTATGAYYAYAAYCRSAGLTAPPLSSYEKLSFGGFLGTLYSKTGQEPAMQNNPDVVEAYVPKGTNSMVTHQADGTVIDWYSIVNKKTDQWYQAAASKYNCFIAGDHPLIEIHNENIAADRKGTSVLLIKESFGNAFAPFLVDSYEYVYIIDYRYYDGGLTEFVTAHGVQDVIFLNNIVAVTADARLNELSDFVGK